MLGRLRDTDLLKRKSMIDCGDEVREREGVTMPDQESEDRMRLQPDGELLFAALPIGIVTLDLACRVTAANPEAQRLLGPRAGHFSAWLASEPRWEARHEDGSTFLPAEHPALTALASGEPFRYAVMGWRDRLQGSLRWFRVQAVPVRQGPQAGLIGVCALFEDITDYRQARIELNEARALAARRAAADEELRRGARYARRLIEVSLDPLVTISPEGKITDVNQATERATGRSREELVGTDFCDYFTEPEQARSGYQQVFLRGQVSDYPLVLRHASGREIEVLYNASVYHDEGGRVLGVFAAARDVTRTNAITRDLERHREHLEELVAQRTSELEAAMHAAQAANLAKSNFLANISHELRTPLNAITGQAYLLQQGGLDERQQEQIRSLQLAARQLLALIDDILDYTRIDSDAPPSARQVFAPAALLGKVIERLQDRAAAKGLWLHVRVEPEVPRWLAGDPVRIGQVLYKLADNGVKFTETGEVELAVMLEARAGDGVRLRFEVRDTGIGLETHEQEGLFDTFRQVDETATRRYGGAGLGLAIARKLVGLMDGRIGVESRKGQGSRFWFSVALGLPEAVPDAQAGTSGPLATCVETPDAGSVAAGGDERQWHELRQRLARMLRESDAASVDLCEQSAGLLQAMLGPRAAGLMQAVQGFDFDAALSELERSP